MTGNIGNIGNNRRKTFINQGFLCSRFCSYQRLNGEQKQKNLKNISKTFQKPIDILIFMCYNIITVRGTPQERNMR
mgnify:CR=1 FL=1